MSKKFKLLLFLIVLFPLNTYALNKEYSIKENGNDNYLYSTYQWFQGAETQEYMSASDCIAKKGEVDYNKKQTQWVKYFSSCEFNVGTGTCSKDLCSRASGKNTGTGAAATKINAEKACLANMSSKITCCVGPNQSKTFLKSEYEKNVKYETTHQFKWSATNPDPDEGTYNSTGTYRYLCTYTSSQQGSLKDGKKNLIQRKYVTDDGNEAYCLEPGREFKNGGDTYVLADTKTLDCKNSKDSENCELAAAFVMAKENNASYLATLTALRLIMASYGKGNSFWDGTNLYNRANIYYITSQYIQSNNYSGATSNPKRGVIYADNTSINDLQLAINIFKKVHITGVDVWTPQVKYTYSSYNTYTKTSTLTFESNFPADTVIESITLSNGKTIPAGNITTSACENDNTKICINATIQLEPSECVKVTAKVKYKNSKDVISRIGYYKSKSNPSKYQEMYIFDKNTTPEVSVTKGLSKNEEPLEFDLCAPDNSCSITSTGKYICKDGNECTKEKFTAECETPKDNTYCDKPVTDTNMPDDCKDSTTGRIEDATMCNILNSETKYKTEFEKTEYENDFCKVYCRETLIFSFMDKETAYAGQSFKHSVGSYYSGKGYLSTVILSKKQCSSEIDYDNWLDEYETANEKVRTTWNTLKEWEAFYNLDNGAYTSSSKDSGCSATHKSCSSGTVIYMEWSKAYYNTTDANGYTSQSSENSKSQSGKSSSCSSGSHSCQRCTTGTDGKRTCTSYYCETCSVSCAVAADSGYVSRHYASALTAYKNALDARDKLLYQIQDCNFMSDNNNSNKRIDTKAVYTKGTYGPYYTVKKENNYTTTANLKTYKSLVNGYKPGNEVDIDYDENIKFNENYDVDIVNEQTDNYATDIGYSLESDWNKYCKQDCDGTLYDLSSEPYLTDTTDNINYWTCTGSETSAKCTKNTLVIPKNKLATITVETETVHYQDAQFYTQVFTGKTSTTKDNISYWITLDEHIFPVGVTRLTGNYEITLDYSNLGESGKADYRRMSSGTYTCSYDVINELTIYDCNDGYHVCYPCSGTEEDCKDYTYNVGLGVYYRNINLNDIFPKSVFSPTYSNINKTTRNIGQNWLTTNAIQVINEIQNNGENVWTKKEPMYSITLSSSAMKTVRNYNSMNNYLNNSLDCDENLRCTSDFLNEFRANYSDLFTKNTGISNNSLYYYKRSW